MPESTTWKVLVIEDRAGITASLLTTRPDFTVAAAHRISAAERLLREQPASAPFQVILLDLTLADLADPQGLGAFRQVRALVPGLPMVVLAPSHAEDAVSILAAEGAQACLPRASATAEVVAWSLRQAVLRSRAEARRFRDLFDSVPMGILLAAGRRVAMANPAALRNLGYAEEDLARLSILDLFPPSLRPDLASALDARLAGEDREISFGTSLIRKDGTPAAAQVHLKGALLNDAPALALYLSFPPSPVTTSQPGPAGPRDPHPASRLEALGRLASGIAHDFNNLFTTINGYSDHLLGMPGVEGALERGLRAIRRAGDAAAAMTRGLMAFGGSGGGQSSAIRVDPAVDEVAPALSSLLGGALRLSIRPGAGQAAVLLEPGRLEQVLLNLAANAREAMPRGGTVALSTEVAASAAGGAFTHLEPRSGGPYVVITLRDEGEGMAGDVLDRLFEPNFTTRAGPKGKGYGLAEVYGIVAGAGGGLSVSSRPGQGSVFRVWLPATEAVPVGDLPAREMPAGGIPDRKMPAPREPGSDAMGISDVTSPGVAAEILGEDAASPGKPRILVVEDEPSLRDMLRAVLERFGYEVEEAVSGGEAEELIAEGERPPDLVISDVLLRDGLGTEMAARLRAGRPGMRFLFISGHSLETLGDRGIRISASEFLEKPFTPSQLSLKARAALSPQSA